MNDLQLAKIEAEAFSKNRDWTGAIVAWKKVIALAAPDNSTESVVHLSRALRMNGQWQSAEDFLRPWMDAAPDDIILLMEHAEIATAAQNNAHAIERWGKVVESGASARAYLSLARINWRLKNKTTALDQVSAGLSLFPDNLLLIEMRASLLFDNRQWLLAGDILEGLILEGKTPTHHGYNLLIRAHQKCGNLEAAKRSLDAATKANAGRPELEKFAAELEQSVRNIRQLEDFMQTVKGQDCVVFGSAPDPTLLDPTRLDKKIITCNGSALSLKERFQREPAMSFIHSHVLTRPNESDADVRAALAKVGHLGQIVLLHGKDPEGDLELIKRKTPGLVRFDCDYRHYILRRLLGYPLPGLDISTGAFAVAACAAFGARSIELAGISLNRKGHGYNANNRYRNHVTSDAALYALLKLRGVNLISSEPSVAMLCTNKIE